jgi:CRP/FNR family cyclic AMP-dependent transcriptional regulator
VLANRCQPPNSGRLVKAVALAPQTYRRAVGDNSSLSIGLSTAPNIVPNIVPNIGPGIIPTRVPNVVPSPVPRLVPGAGLSTGWNSAPTAALARELPFRSTPRPDLQPNPQPHPQEIDPLYLFACRLEWEQKEEPSAAWELLAAAQSPHGDTRAHARALVASSHQLGGLTGGSSCAPNKKVKRPTATETNMKAPYGLDIIDNCTACTHSKPGFFCEFSFPVLQALNQASHKSILPAGAILFVEGQSPRGMFILCAGRVNLSTTSREGKILILKTAEAGEALGLSATISGMGYESTAVTATPCQLNYVDRKNFLELLDTHSEVGRHAAQSLSRDYQSAYRDIHDLVLTRSSAGKLARLLLSLSPTLGVEDAETRIHSSMTHEELAQRIGSSRETVSRLLSDLRKKQLIRLDGPTLVIRDRTALAALAV